MPIFAIIAHDKPDAEAPERRRAARTAHFERITLAIEAGRIHFAGSMVKEGTMTCSIVIAEFPDRADFDAWVSEEPYLKNGAWDRIDTAPPFVAVQNGAITPAWLDVMDKHRAVDG